MTTTTTTKATCPRCSGSGHYSFNLISGTVCFRCNGAGVVMVNLTNEARNQKARAARESQSEARRQMNIAVYNQVVAEMNAIHQVENIDTLLGIELLDRAVWESTGRTIAQLRDERIKGN